MPRTSDKRERLLKAGRELIHRQGYARTTLADIAKASGVPLGNVYYYFHTKEDILHAVSGELSDNFRTRAKRFERQPTPRARLLALLDSVIEGRKLFAERGCPVGSLFHEMSREGAIGRDRISQALILRAQWAAEQFRSMGRTDAQELGVWLIGSIQGVILMANALQDPGVIERQVKQLQAWISAL